MTLILRVSNLLSFLRKAEAARTTRAERAAARAEKSRMSGHCSEAEEFGRRAAADAWQYACNQRAFR